MSFTQGEPGELNEGYGPFEVPCSGSYYHYKIYHYVVIENEYHEILWHLVSFSDYPDTNPPDTLGAHGVVCYLQGGWDGNIVHSPGSISPPLFWQDEEGHIHVQPVGTEGIKTETWEGDYVCTYSGNVPLPPPTLVSPLNNATGVLKTDVLVWSWS